MSGHRDGFFTSIQIIERRFTPRMIASSETLSAWSGMLVDGGTWDIHFDSVCKKVHRDESTALKLTLRRPQVWGVPRLSHHICRCAVAVDAIGRGLRHRKAACETHGQEKRGEELNEHTRAVMSEHPAPHGSHCWFVALCPHLALYFLLDNSGLLQFLQCAPCLHS